MEDDENKSKEIEEDEKIKEILDKRFTNDNNNNESVLLLAGAVVGVVVLLIFGALLAGGAIGDIMNMLTGANNTSGAENITVSIEQPTDNELENVTSVSDNETMLEPEPAPENQSGEVEEAVSNETVEVIETSETTSESNHHHNNDHHHNENVLPVVYSLSIGSNGYVNTREVFVSYDVYNVNRIEVITDIIGSSEKMHCENQRCHGEIHTLLGREDGAKTITVKLINSHGSITKKLSVILDTHSPARIMDVRAVQLGSLQPKVKVTWGPSDEECTFTLFRSQLFSLPWHGEMQTIPKIIAEGVTEMEYVDTNVSFGKTYVYYVLPVDLAHNPGTFSPPVQITVINPNPHPEPDPDMTTAPVHNET